MTLDLRQLRHLLAIAEHGTFGRAATALGMTQPALSRSVQGLEHQVGAELFQRSKRGVVPTDEGRSLILRARTLVTAADELDREVTRRKVPGSGQVNVGVGPYPSPTSLPDALARFTAAHPLVRVRAVVSGDWDELLRRLRARELDAFVAETSTLEDERDLNVEPLPRHPVYFAVRAGHPLTRRAVVTAAHAFAYPFVALTRYPPRVLDPMLAKLREVGALSPGRPFPAIELASLAAVKGVLARSDAIAPLMLSSIAQELEHGTLAVLLTERWIHTGYGLVTLKNVRLGAAAIALCELLREAEAALVREEARLIERYAPGGKPKRRKR
jgi:DNA-binding transcriptional LysR family regulator